MNENYLNKLKQDMRLKNFTASTINVCTAAIRFFFEYTLGYAWDSKKIPKMKRDRKPPAILTREQINMMH